MPWVFIAIATGGALAYEKLGDWWNVYTGTVTVPAEYITGTPSKGGSAWAMGIGAALVLGAVYLMQRGR